MCRLVQLCINQSYDFTYAVFLRATRWRTGCNLDIQLFFKKNVMHNVYDLAHLTHFSFFGAWLSCAQRRPYEE